MILELYQSFGTEMERIHTLNKLRKGAMPDDFSAKWPVQVRKESERERFLN